MSAKQFSMQRMLKRTAVLGMLVLGVQLSHGFALLGPFEPYHGGNLGYRQPYAEVSSPGAPTSLQDLGGPHQYDEEFRRVLPVLYYSFDETFAGISGGFFGSNGVAAVDQAFAIMNSLTNVSQYSTELSEFPLQAQRINYQAQSLALTDVKSITLHLLVEQMGLAQPDRYSWTLHDRAGTTCPATMGYQVIQRNFEVFPTPVNTLQASPYVNGTLYTYGIIEFCTPPTAVAVPYAVDPLAETYTAVAADALPIALLFAQGLNSGGIGLHIGGFYTYLTRDDVGGLRYLLQANNINYEESGPDTVQYVTNSLSPTPLPTFDLGLLASLAPTNTAAQLQAIFPGLVDTSTVIGFALLTNRDVSLVITNPPFAPAGTFTTVFVTNTTVTFTPLYSHTFDNVITNQFSSRSVITYQTVSLKAPPFAPAGAAVTNITTKNFVTNAVAGEFYLIPTNLCAVVLLTNILNLPTVVATTNSITATNPAAATVTNLTGIIAQNVITYFTNHAIAYLPVTCPANTVGYRQGVERVRFVRRDDYDSITGRFFNPVTNNYTLTEFNITNSTLHKMQFQRVAIQPDFLFQADDIASGPAQNLFIGTVQRFMNFAQVNSNGIAAGPGSIESPTTFTFNKVGPIYWNFFNSSLFSVSLAGFVADESSELIGIAWGSFDGSTNDPVVYPNGTSIQNYVNQLLMQVYPQTLPSGQSGVPYSFVYTNPASGTIYTNALSATGGQPPYTWSLAPLSAGLPSGMNLTPDGQITGAPVVTNATIFDFTIRATDSNFRSVDAPFSITIVP